MPIPGLMYVALYTFIIHKFFGHCEVFSAKFTNFVCTSANAKLAIFDSCELKAVKRNVAEISFHLRFLPRPVYDANVTVSFYKRSNGYTRIMPSISSNVCNYLAKPRGNPFLDAFLSLFSNESNLNHRCPYNSITVRSLRARNPGDLIPFPQGEYLYRIELSFWDLRPGVIWKVFFKTLHVIIGAPRAQSTFKSQGSVNETGAIFKCPFKYVNSTGALEIEGCMQLPIDKDGNFFPHFGHYLSYRIKDHQWLGASMDGGFRDTDPLLICAPRFVGGYDIGQYESYLHGICYWTMNTGYGRPQDRDIFQIKSLTNPDYQNIVTNYGLNWYFQIGQQGFSAHITPNNEEFLMGSPGIYMWKGSVVHYEMYTRRERIPTILMNGISYMGYAVGSGHFDAKNLDKIFYISTGPRANLMGEAVIFDFVNQGSVIKRRGTLTGEQFGEFFGYAVLVEDINSDDLDDILISAPLYCTKDTVELGAVYVYLNKGGFKFESTRLVSPFKTQARFGTTLSKLGDINQDGYFDIAIGAPFIDDRGAVLIYLGGPKGLQPKPSQILRLDSSADIFMFGHGLSKGVDIDGNGYNDLAIGAPDSEVVYIYRSYPVVDIEATIQPTEASIGLNQTSFEIEICYKMSTQSEFIENVKLNLNLEVDGRIKRITFKSNRENFISFSVNATKTMECQLLEANVKFLPIFVFTPMIMEMQYKLDKDAEDHRTKDFCNDCSILVPTNPRSAQSSMTYRHGCKGKVCKVNLKVSALRMPSNFTLGTANVLYANYSLENLGEKAFDTKVEIFTSLNLTFAKIPPHCMENNRLRNKLICNINYGHGFVGQTDLEVGFDVSNVLEAFEMNVTAVATSGGQEIQLKDNILNSTITFYLISALEVIGESNDTFVSIVNKTANVETFYSFKIQNNGPSPLNALSLWLFIPKAYTDMRNVSLEFMNFNATYASMMTVEHDFSPVHFDGDNFFPIVRTINENVTIKERTYLVDQFLPENSTITLQCNPSITENCASVQLGLPLIKVGEKIWVNLVMSTDAKAVKKILRKSLDYLELYMDVAFEPASKMKVELNVTKILKPLILVNIGPPGTPLWVYILAAVGGILLLTLLSLGLRRLGFFKRQTKEEMEEKINEKLEKARMKAELESEALMGYEGNSGFE